MKKLASLVVVALVAAGALYACGDNHNKPDAPRSIDSPPADALQIPTPPTIPANSQIDRMGRPAINTALNHAFDGSAAAKGAAKDAYNQDMNVAGWVPAYAGQPAGSATGANQFAFNLAVLDDVDEGFTCTNGLCSTSNCSGGTGSGNACGSAADCPGTGATCVPLNCSAARRIPSSGCQCGNQVLYNGNLTGGGSAVSTSYLGVPANGYTFGNGLPSLAAVLANDMLVVDTSKGTCSLYLAVEFGVVSGQGNTTCGGRTPAYDVMGVSYSALAFGIGAFKVSDSSYAPFVSNANLGSGVAAVHGDITTSFPFLGAPHN